MELQSIFHLLIPGMVNANPFNQFSDGFLEVFHPILMHPSALKDDGSKGALASLSDDEEPCLLDPFNSFAPATAIHPFFLPIHSEYEEPLPSFQPPAESHLTKPVPALAPNDLNEAIQKEPNFGSDRVDDRKEPFIPVLSEGVEHPLSAPPATPRFHFHHLPHQEPVAFQEPDGQFTHPPASQDGPKGTSSTSTLLKEGDFEIEQLIVTPVVTPKDIPTKEPVYPILGEKGYTKFSFESRREIGEGKCPSSPQNFTNTPFTKEEANRIFQFEFNPPERTTDTSHRPDRGEPERMFTKGLPHSSEFHSARSEMGTIIKTETTLSDGGLKVPPHSSLQVRSFDMDQQVGKVLLQSIQNGEERIRMRLDPPQLGTLYIKVTKEQEVLKTTVWTENSLTKELLETYQGELRRVLEGDGFKLEKFDVFVQQETNLPWDRRDFSFIDERERNGFQNGRGFHEFESSEPPFDEGSSWRGSSHYVDRIV